MEAITESALIERRELINAVDAASKALNAALAPLRGDMGLVNDRHAASAERAAYAAAERALAAFYVRWPLKTYRKEFTAETKQNRGW